jgi:hypothetical protein
MQRSYMSVNFYDKLMDTENFYPHKPDCDYDERMDAVMDRVLQLEATPVDAGVSFFEQRTHPTKRRNCCTDVTRFVPSSLSSE